MSDGSRIKVEVVHSDGYVSARQVEGEFEGMLVVCAISKLQPDSEGSCLTPSSVI